MLQFKKVIPALLLIGCSLSGLACKQEPAETVPPNILFIAIDDLRPQLGAYGYDQMVTPNLDKLASAGRLFTRHFVQVPTCGASRYSLLTGTRPHLPEHLNNQAFSRLMPKEEQARPESFAHHFKRNGYFTASIGKISHTPDGRLFTYEGEGDGALEMPLSWDKVWGPVDKWGTGWNAFFGYADGSNRNMERGVYPAYESADVSDTAYPDGLIAQEAMNTLGEVRDRPFLLAVGFFKPHLPFTAPKKYWDLYEASEIDLSPNPDAPVGVAEGSLHASNEMFRNYGAHTSESGLGVQIDDEHARTLRHGYYASVSFVDAQVGKVLDELDELGLRDNTIVVVWGDHGWHLGDHTLWGKHATFDRALRSTLIIQTPAMPNPGLSANGIVETLDIYPTLTELAGLETPGELGGTSLVDMLNKPEHPGKNGALGYWRNRRTLRTDQYRLTQYDDGQIELFDHQSDPNETTNVADAQPQIVARLQDKLRSQTVSLQNN